MVRRRYELDGVIDAFGYGSIMYAHAAFAWIGRTCHY